MKRSFVVVAGLVIVLHGIAHSWLGVWASSYGPLWAVTPLWTIAMAGYVAAGFGIMGVRGLRAVWPVALLAATFASLALLAGYGHGAFTLGVAADLMIVAILAAEVFIRPAFVPPPVPYHHPALATAAAVVATIVLAYVTVVPLTRPLTTGWGSTPAERAAAVPGDTFTLDARYRLDHSIVIKAPADTVWPWLVQLGQDKAGFYSYDWLERLAGAHVHNAYRVHAAWQSLAEGDLVRAVQPDFMGGRLGNEVGWRVSRLEPPHLMVLDNLGAFILVPIDSETTRLTVRTRGPGTPSLTSVVLGPINVFVFEPAHFIMQRGMLKGIRDRVELRPI